ncbi:hypothetical protein HELRODRAFT_161142 [Helobdella robusta]|uniref:Sarcoplasmic reticulum histidine-rich calcium-binding protein n=1 Tax=Helobdella robusta TaxID=6412 RepID=T1ER50_HELRO|nr:hypothetical protein HELRODRAFT_161142 [Helobdella robusta]ESO01936.1 hypothetical protein HELRODRAFT_161142 [Helobdella robusta]
MEKFYLFALCTILSLCCNSFANEDQQPLAESPDAEYGGDLKSAEEGAAGEEEMDLSKEQDPEMEYKKGSLCGYCTYCKFCKMCDRDCPCTKSPTRPNCDLCKYCKYCYLCKLACDTFCQPGGYVDRYTSLLFRNFLEKSLIALTFKMIQVTQFLIPFSKLPYYDKEEIDNDLNKVKDWIDKNKDEL